MNTIGLQEFFDIKIFILIFSIFNMSPAAAGGATLTDGAIIAIYNQVNTFDIETAGLGVTKSHDRQVMKLAKMVQKDHTAVRQMAADLAIKLNVDRTLPAGRTEAMMQHAQVYKSLSSKKGADFDRAYLRHEIAFHTAAIKAVKDALIPSAKSEELRALMKKILPGFEHHLHETKRVAKELGY